MTSSSHCACALCPLHRMSIAMSCVFCGRKDLPSKDVGPVLGKHPIAAHHHCLYFSSGLAQNGSEDQGINGFMVSDIINELKRGFKSPCSYCKKKGSLVGCSVASCRKAGHFPCLLRNKFLFQYFGKFEAWCPAHRPTQEALDKAATMGKGSRCVVCEFELSGRDSFNTLYCPSCLNFLHRDCIQKQALTAGLHFFRCPFCNDSKEFTQEMLRMGIYIPERDAQWEGDGQFEDLHRRRGRKGGMSSGAGDSSKSPSVNVAKHSSKDSLTVTLTRQPTVYHKPNGHTEEMKTQEKGKGEREEEEEGEGGEGGVEEEVGGGNKRRAALTSDSCHCAICEVRRELLEDCFPSACEGDSRHTALSTRAAKEEETKTSRGADAVEEGNKRRGRSSAPGIGSATSSASDDRRASKQGITEIVVEVFSSSSSSSSSPVSPSLPLVLSPPSIGSRDMTLLRSRSVKRPLTSSSSRICTHGHAHAQGQPRTAQNTRTRTPHHKQPHRQPLSLTSEHKHKKKLVSPRLSNRKDGHLAGAETYFETTPKRKRRRAQ